MNCSTDVSESASSLYGHTPSNAHSALTVKNMYQAPICLLLKMILFIA